MNIIFLPFTWGIYSLSSFPLQPPSVFKFPISTLLSLFSPLVYNGIYILRSTSYFSVPSMKLETSLSFTVTQHIYLYAVAP